MTMLRNTKTLVVDGLLDWMASANLSSSCAEEAVTETGSQLGHEKDVLGEGQACVWFLPLPLSSLHTFCRALSHLITTLTCLNVPPKRYSWEQPWAAKPPWLVSWSLFLAFSLSCELRCVN